MDYLYSTWTLTSWTTSYPGHATRWMASSVDRVVFSCTEMQVFYILNCNVVDWASWTLKMGPFESNHLGNIPTRFLFKLKLCSLAEDVKNPSLGLKDLG